MGSELIPCNQAEGGEQAEINSRGRLLGNTEVLEGLILPWIDGRTKLESSGNFKSNQVFHGIHFHALITFSDTLFRVTGM